jgi:PDZ domain
MSDSERRTQRIAVGFAVVAMGVAVLAGIVVLTRRAESSREPHASRHVQVSDLGKFTPGAVQQGGEGVRVIDQALGTALGLAGDDTILAISGRPVTSPSELAIVLGDLEVFRPRSLFVELVRDRARVLERWELDGDREAARPADAGARAPRGTPSPVDPLIATVRQQGRTVYALPRSTVDTWLADPTRAMAGVAVLGAVDRGGFEIAAIRPGSIFEALGLQRGDVVRGINGAELGSADQVLELIAKSAQQITVDVRRGSQTILFNYLIQ